MKHIFYLHSNICVISSFDTIIEFLEKGETVVVISERNTRFPAFEDKIQTYDVETIIDKYRKNTSNVFMQVMNYRFDLIPRYREFAKTVIANEDFEIYIPSYCMHTILPFLRNKHCKGYFFLEEGTLSYLSSASLRRSYLTRRYKKGRFLLDLLGAGEPQDYKITDCFKGCICVAREAFPWCEIEKKKITGLNAYFNTVTFVDIEMDHLIITDYLRSDKDVILKAFRFIIDGISVKKENARIGVKFHPTAYMYEREKVKDIFKEIRLSYPQISFIQLPASFSVESLMYHRKICLYSVFGVSSLLLYSLYLDSESNMLRYNNGEIVMENIPSIESFIKIINQG